MSERDVRERERERERESEREREGGWVRKRGGGATDLTGVNARWLA